MSVGSRRRTWIAATVGAVALYYLVASAWKAEQVAPTPALAGAIRVGIAAAAGGIAWLALGASRQWAICVVVLLLAATTLRRSQTYSNDEAIWRDAILKAPANPRGYYDLEVVLSRRNPPPAAEEDQLLGHAIALDSSFALAWYQLGINAFTQGRHADARRDFERVLRLDPHHAGTLDHLGTLIAMDDGPDQAIPYLEQATEYGNDAQSFVDLGVVRAALGQSGDAVTALRRALALDPSRTDALSQLGAVLTENGKAREAIPYLERAATSDSSSSLILARLSLAYAASGRAADAAETGRRAVMGAEGQARVYTLVGRAMVIAGRAGEAEEYLSASVRLDPENAATLTALGSAKIALGKRADAAALFRRALELDPEDALARQALDGMRARKGAGP